MKENGEMRKPEQMWLPGFEPEAQATHRTSEDGIDVIEPSESDYNEATTVN